MSKICVRQQMAHGCGKSFGIVWWSENARNAVAHGVGNAAVVSCNDWAGMGLRFKKRHPVSFVDGGPDEKVRACI